MKDNSKSFTVPQDQVGHGNSLAKIRAAMIAKQSILFNYDGEPRLVEVHAVGLTKKGQLALRGYQSAGGSNSGTPQWRLFTLDKIQSLDLTFMPSHAPRDGYVQGDSAMPQILFELDGEQ